MKSLCRNIYRREKGFTLVELMVVIIILAILTGIAIPSYLALRSRARESATRSEMANIGTALELYMADLEEYPDAADWATAGTGAADLIETAGYMTNVPDDDSWDNVYDYTRTSATEYTLYSFGPDEGDDSGLGDDIVLHNGILAE